MHLNPAHQRMKSCVRYLCCASVRLQISSLSFAFCWTVLNALFTRIAIVQRILSNRQPPYWIVWFSICCVVVGHRSHRYASFLCLVDEEIILRQYSRNLIFAVLAANCGEFANVFSMDYSISRENEAREEALLNESSKYSVHREACCWEWSEQ